jgi:hypothetical protein
VGEVILMMKRSLLFVLVGALSACEQRDPLFCSMHLDDPRCLAGGDGGLPEGYYVIGGNVAGLTGSGLVLLNNGGDDKQVSSSGSFSFATPVLMGSTYDITVGTQPTNPSEMCTVANGTGTANSDVLDVAVTCMPAAYTVGGNVAGFQPGGNIVLTNNGVDDKTITAGGPFTFLTPIRSGQPYDVEIKSQTNETCSIVANIGTVGSGPVSTVVVVCGSNLYTVGGTTPVGGVTGLNGTVKLKNNNTDEITINTNGSFAFPTPISGGGNNPYAVTVSQQPTYPPKAQDCQVSNGSGTVGTANITNVKVTCTTKSFTIGGNVSGLNGTLVLKNNGGDTKTITANGAFTFATPIQSGNTYAVTVGTQPSGQQCTITSGSGTVTNANITNVSVTCVNVGVKCGSNYCNGGNLCCDPEGSPSCKTSQQCNAFELPCDDSRDCGGNNKCCAQRHNGTFTLEFVRCESSCNNVNNPIQLCDPTQNQCPNGTTCQPWNQLPGYYACQ